LPDEWLDGTEGEEGAQPANAHTVTSDEKSAKIRRFIALHLTLQANTPLMIDLQRCECIKRRPAQNHSAMTIHIMAITPQCHCQPHSIFAHCRGFAYVNIIQHDM
jgi:hypothetical protein